MMCHDDTKSVAAVKPASATRLLRCMTRPHGSDPHASVTGQQYRYRGGMSALPFGLALAGFGSRGSGSGPARAICVEFLRGSSLYILPASIRGYITAGH